MSKADAHLLTDLNLEEISAVNAGANKGAKIILLKTESDIMEIKERNVIVAKIAEYFGVGKKEGDTLVIKTGDEPVSDDLKELQKQLAAQGSLILKLSAQNALGVLISGAVDAIAKASDAAGIDTLLAKSKVDVAAIVKDNKIEDADLIKAFGTMVDGDLTERAKARKAELEKATSQEDMTKFRDKLPGALQKAFDGMDEDERAAFMSKFSKSDESDPVVKLAKALDDSSTEIAELKKTLGDMQSESEVAKAHVEFKDLAKHISLDEFIPNIIKLRKVDNDAAEAIITQVKAMAAQASAANIFSIHGKGGGGESDADSALDKAVAKYKVENPECASDEIAMAKVLEDPANAGLYTDYLEQEDAG